MGGILLNQQGKRFVNELGRRDDVTGAMYKWCRALGEAHAPAERDPHIRSANVKPRPVRAYLVVSNEAAVRFGPNFQFYVAKGFFKAGKLRDGIDAP